MTTISPLIRPAPADDHTCPFNQSHTSRWPICSFSQSAFLPVSHLLALNYTFIESKYLKLRRTIRLTWQPDLRRRQCFIHRARIPAAALDLHKVMAAIVLPGLPKLWKLDDFTVMTPKQTCYRNSQAQKGSRQSSLLLSICKPNQIVSFKVRSDIVRLLTPSSNMPEWAFLLSIHQYIHLGTCSGV